MTEKIKGRWWDIELPDNVELVKAKRCLPWKADPKGYFLIRVNHKEKQIELALCNYDNKIIKIITGKHPIEIYQTLIKNELVSQLDHVADLGAELEKAYIAMREGIKYVQDSDYELDFSKKV